MRSFGLSATTNRSEETVSFDTLCVRQTDSSTATPALTSTDNEMSCPLRSPGRRYCASIFWLEIPCCPRATAPTASDFDIGAAPSSSAGETPACAEATAGRPEAPCGGLNRGPTTIGKTNSYQPST